MMRLVVTFAAFVALALFFGTSDACRGVNEGCADHIPCCEGMTCAPSHGMWGFCKPNRNKRQSGAAGGATGGGSGSTHIVVSGDTLYNIGLKYGKDWKQIATANNIANPELIYPGQVLNI